MKRSEYEAKMKNLQDEIEALKKVEIEEDIRRWKPVSGDTYYTINSKGHVLSDTWAGWGDDNAFYSMGNCFATYEEAEFAVEKLKVLAELKEFAEPRDAEWDGAIKHYCIRYNTDKRELVTDYNYLFKHAVLYFKSVEIVKEAIAKVGEERIKKYYLEVE